MREIISEEENLERFNVNLGNVKIGGLPPYTVTVFEKLQVGDFAKLKRTDHIVKVLTTNYQKDSNFEYTGMDTKNHGVYYFNQKCIEKLLIPPFFSVILCAHHASQTLTQCIESLKSQFFGYMEFILIDDGSTTGATEIYESWRQSDSRVSIIRQTFSETADALLAGVNAAKGTHVLFLNGTEIASHNHYIFDYFYQALSSLR